MKRWIIAAVCPLLFLLSTCSEKKATDLEITNLRCEYLKDPLGIDVVLPRLSWILESSVRGQKQTAYRIIVSSSEENLKRNRGDLWDSGKIKSDRTNQIVYSGRDLQSRKKCYWKVFVWDKDGARSENGKPSFLTLVGCFHSNGGYSSDGLRTGVWDKIAGHVTYETRQANVGEVLVLCQA